MSIKTHSKKVLQELALAAFPKEAKLIKEYRKNNSYWDTSHPEGLTEKIKAQVLEELMKDGLIYRMEKLQKTSRLKPIISNLAKKSRSVNNG